MTPKEAQSERNAVETVAVTEDGREPYRAPQLRRLGSVRELTLGATGNDREPVGKKP